MVVCSSNKRFLAIVWTVAGAVTWAACSGGTEGPSVEGPGPGNGESPVPGPPPGSSTEPPPIPTNTTTTPTGTTVTGTGTGTGTVTGTGTMTGTGTGSGACTTCAEVLVNQEPPTNLCSTAVAPLNDLLDCMCISYCGTDCATFCSTYVVDGTCSTCANTYCITELSACASN